MAQRRLPKDEEEEEGNREEEQAGADREERREDADEQPGDRQDEGRDGRQVHELVLEVMARKDLADSVLQGGSRRVIRLRLAAEAAEARIILDLLAAFPTEHAGAPFRRPAAAVIAANYTGVPGAYQPNSNRAVTKYTRGPLQALRVFGEIMQCALSVFLYNEYSRFVTTLGTV
jgi:hypothetical protein